VKVLNIHERRLRASPRDVGALIDSLASSEDLLWPRHSWPRMKFDRPLGVGATGGHGPIRYFVESHDPGRSIRFRFLGPSGFDGFHGFDVVPANDDEVLLRNTLKMGAHGPALVSWPLVFGPMHDALMEDALAQAEASLGLPPEVSPWSPWVKLLRRCVGGAGAPEQITPPNARG